MARLPCLLLLCAACAGPGAAPPAVPSVRPTDARPAALARPVTLELEGGALWQARNDVRIPGDTGTRFPLDALADDDPYAVWRLTADWDLDERNALRAVIAPLEVDGTGTLAQPTSFAGADFAAGVPTQATYQFSSYRLGYRYTFHHDELWRLRVGGTLFVRDAKVELQQGATRASDSDVGLVPLVNFAAEYRPAEAWRLVAELDGLASAQGRALDLSLKAHHDLSDRWSVGLGYRTIEGGADNDDVYSFAWLNSLVVSVSFRP